MIDCFFVLVLETPLQGDQIGFPKPMHAVSVAKHVGPSSIIPYLQLSVNIRLGLTTLHHLFITSEDVLSSNLQYSHGCLAVAVHVEMCIFFFLNGVC
jgi:hypothetical protein